MLAMAALAGPQRTSWLHPGDVVDADKLFGKRRGVSALRSSLISPNGSLQERTFFQVPRLSVSFARAAPQWFRLAALPEDGIIIETAEEEPVLEEPAVEVPAYEGPTVKVKFELQRECHFGQEFKVVGNDSQFGDWVPSVAVPLNWSEGHLWTAEVDVPEGKKIEFKYVLCGQGEVGWQPGSNHVLETAAGAGSIIVSVPWEEPQPEPPTELEVQPAEPEVQSAESGTRGWERVSGDPEVNTPADALADAAASAAVGALNAGVKAATTLGGGLDALSDSPNRETNGVAESKEETPTAVEIPVVDAALAAAAAEEPASNNGATMTGQTETAIEEKRRIEQSKMEAEPRTKEQPKIQPKKRVNPFQKDIDWLSKTLFGR